ncbi:xanthine dehydrogenase isoform X2 [Lingula anatina]|uniref:Xanthine dehydrogenase isoform X2 n=1 Tax=Lingula anatina TaxID=7574 RepID=A0A1S3J976_LINAN|nr:xanthine dehydrogenase isoform X2 [Lingula anatina]|eukprot:XP_013406957.1 xanthine dehydrogenase isoform X2 [Lingula anatina]
MSDRTSDTLRCPKCGTSHVPLQVSLGSGVYFGTCQSCGSEFKFKKSTQLESAISFKVNGTLCQVDNRFEAEMSLNEYIRTVLKLTGTKVMCNEGGCGSCHVTIAKYDPITKANKPQTINSCLWPVYGCHNLEITTVEGIGDKFSGYHPIQKALADGNGSQCGFCSPGMVMNMYSFLGGNPKPTKEQIEDAYDGNICRCTGYRPILDAMKTFAVDSTDHVIDIEDLSSRQCPKTGQACTGQCGPKSVKPVHLVLSTSQWLIPVNLLQLYQMVVQNKSKPTKLVLGNTAGGSYDVYIDLKSVPELYQYSNAPVTIGSNFSLSALMEVLTEVATLPGYSYCSTLVIHLKRVANTSVRNAGGWAGNLMLKKNDPGFPSDVFVILETVGAVLNIASCQTQVVSRILLTDFLAIDMSQSVILNVVLPTMTVNDYVRTFKIQPRVQSSLAYVSAGFRFKVNNNTEYKIIQQPSIVFGGISSTFVHASQTEEYLTGKSLLDQKTLTGAYSTLANEISPMLEEGSPDYRKRLAVALFYKCVLSIVGEKAGARMRSGATKLIDQRPVSSGQQSFDTDPSKYPLNEPMPKVLARQQTAGEAMYILDQPAKPGQLYGAFVTSTEGNAKIASIDTAVAQNVPGFVRFISAKDIPGENDVMGKFGQQKEMLFVTDQVEYAGQAIGLVVADTLAHAEAAASAVQVNYTDVQPPIVTIEDAIAKKSFIEPFVDEFKLGDADAAVAGAPKKISGQIKMGPQYHVHMETQTSFAVPKEDGYDVYCSTQWIDLCQQACARVLGIQQNKIDVSVPRLGGAYGGKITRNSPVAAASALAAYVTRKPVHIHMSLGANMKMLGKRIPYVVNYEVGVTNDGKLLGIVVTYYANGGILANETAMPLQGYIDSVYNCPCWHIIPKGVKTNTPTATACRAPGSLEAIYWIEVIMEHVAKELGKDPLEVKQANFYKTGQLTPVKMPLTYCNIGPMVTAFAQSAEISKRKADVALFNKNNRWKKKGLSVVPLKWGTAWATANYNVLVTIMNGDGSVAVTHAGIESGQGINTKVVQVCAYELGIDISKVSVKAANSVVNANSITTGGSITSEINCKAVIECCKMLKTRMDPVRQKMVDPKWEDLVNKCFQENVDLCARYFVVPNSTYMWQYNVYGVTCAEVTVDVLTGERNIDRVDILEDCGDSMNPDIDVGQVEGGFVMGLGYWLLEDIKFDPKTGQNQSASTWSYHPPLCKDIPADFRIQLLKNAPNPLGVLGSKAVGEPPLCMSSAVLFAAKHAVEAARQELGNTNHFQLDVPATVEALQTACLVDPSQFTLQ